MDLKTYLEGCSQSDLAERLGVTQGAVWQWVHGKTRITAERAIEIDLVTGGVVSRHELRPDVFGPPQAADG